MSILVNALESAGQWQLAIAKFTELRAAGVQPNAICYNAAISALAKGAQADAAKALVATMRREGLSPDIYTYAPLVGALGSAGLVDEALQVREWTLVTALCFCCALGSAGLVSEALQARLRGPSVLCFRVLGSAGVAHEALQVRRRALLCAWVRCVLCFWLLTRSALRGSWTRCCRCVNRHRVCGQEHSVLCFRVLEPGGVVHEALRAL